MVCGGDIKLLIKNRIARRIFVDIGCSVTNPLTRNEDGEFYVKLNLTHFKRSGVRMAEEILNKSPIFRPFFSPFAIGNASRLNNSTIISHIINHSHKTMIQYRKGLIKNIF